MDFLSFYPMSPSTGVSTFAAQHAEDFEIVVEQVEDEISAINMALGAWYAGARAMVSTSGGGFALMSEAISLAGMAENRWWCISPKGQGLLQVSQRGRCRAI